MSARPLPERATAIELWQPLNPKPTIIEFHKMLCAHLGKELSLHTVRNWRDDGFLPGDLPPAFNGKRARPGTAAEMDAIRPTPTKELAEVVHKTVKECEKSAAVAASLDVVYSRERVKETAYRAIVMAEAFMTHLTKAVSEVKIDTPAGVAALANAAAVMIDKVNLISEGLKLIDYAEAAPKIEDPVASGNVESLRERIEAARAARAAK